jgi:hypothetical protein
MVTLWLWACLPPLDPDDVRLSPGAPPYQPAGLLCGLAYRGGGGLNLGGSCGDFDPALKIIDTSLVLVAEDRRLDRPCPAEGDPFAFGDRDSYNHPEEGLGDFATCTRRESNLLESSGELRDLPEGAVCGLSIPTSLDTHGTGRACEGLEPARDLRCPEGYRLRWVPDSFLDHVDAETCLPDGSTEGAGSLGADAIFFCEVEADRGCTGSSCLEPSRYTGLICGLHPRSSWSVGLSEEAWADPGSSTYDAGLYALLLESWFEPCSEQDEALALLLELMQAGVPDPPTCMGVDLTEGQCPEGWELDCVPGWSGVAADPEQTPLNNTALCWCTPAGARQQREGAFD